MTLGCASVITPDPVLLEIQWLCCNDSVCETFGTVHNIPANWTLLLP